MKILVGAAGGALFMLLSCGAFYYAAARARAKARRRAGVSSALIANSDALVRLPDGGKFARVPRFASPVAPACAPPNSTQFRDGGYRVLDN